MEELKKTLTDKIDWQLKTETPTIVCAWCKKIIKKGSEVESHTVCCECKKKILEESL